MYHRPILQSIKYRVTHFKIYLRIERWLRKRQNQRIFLQQNPEAKIEAELMSWWSPVRDEFRGLREEEIKIKFQKQSLPGAVAMCHLTGDFNIATVIRAANAFGIKDIFYWGKKKIDRRGAVCSYQYMNIIHLSSFAELQNLKKKYFLVAVEQSKKAIPITDFQWPSNSLLILGEEKSGLSREVIDLVDAVVEIPMVGTIRSLNAGVAAGIAINSYSTFLSKNTNV